MCFFEEDGSEAIGIDLGTRNSVVVKFNNKGDYTFLEEHGRQVIKSALYFNSPDDILFGERAEARGLLHPKSLLRCFKRGLTGDTGKLVDGRYQIECNDGTELRLTPKEVSSTFLRNLIDRFNDQNDCNARKLVLTVPAKFGYSLCAALRQAGILDVGMDDVLIVQEPVAAAICYDYEVETIPNDSSLLVYDLGAGTFDVSLLKRKTDGTLEFTDTNGDVHLGGEDFTEKVFIDGKNYFYDNEFFDLDDKNNFDSEEEYAKNIEVLRDVAEKAKEELSLYSQYGKPVTFRQHGKKVDYNWIITKNQFDAMIVSYINRSIEKIDVLLKRNNMTKDDVNRILVVGGSSLIPLVEKKLRDYFGNDDKIVKNSDKELMIGKGAAIIANQIFQEESKTLRDAISFSGMIQKVSDTIGIAIGNSSNIKEIIPRGSKIPFDVTLNYQLNQLVNNDNCIDISFHSYDDIEMKNKIIVAHDSNVEYIGKYLSTNVANYHDDDLVKVNVSINNEFIIKVDVEVAGDQLNSGTVRRDGM